MANQRAHELSALGSLTLDDLLVYAEANYATGSITGATQANPCVITSTAHGLANGDIVYIHGVGGMTQINNLSFTAASVATNTFELSGINSSGYGAYTSGGTWIRGRLQKITAQSLLNYTRLVLPGTCQHRLSLETGVSFSTTDQTAKTTVYLVPHVGTRLSMYNSSEWTYHTCPEIGITLGTKTSGKNYDIFAFTSSATPSSTDTGTDTLTFGAATGWETGAVVRAASTNGGLTGGTDYWYRAATSTTGTLHTTLAGAIANTGKVDLTASVTVALTAISLEWSAAWTNDTARADAIARQDGAWVKSGTTSRSYLGTIRTTSTTETADADATRYCWNHHNRLPKRCYKTENTSHVLNNTAAREWNNATGARAEFVIGLADQSVTWSVTARATASTVTPSTFIYGALDTTGYNWSQFYQGATNNFQSLWSTQNVIPSIGYHYFTIREAEFGSVNCTVDNSVTVGRIDG